MSTHNMFYGELCNQIPTVSIFLGCGEANSVYPDQADLCLYCLPKSVCPKS